MVPFKICVEAQEAVENQGCNTEYSVFAVKYALRPKKQLSMEHVI